MHAIQDSSSDDYLKEVRIFLQNVKMHRLPVSTPAQIDETLARELEFRCFGLEQNVSRGRALVWGWLTVFPACCNSLPLTRRALVGWERLHIGGEGEPLWIGLVAILIAHFLENGLLWEALCVWLSYDSCAWESDWETLVWSQVFVIPGKKVGDPPKVSVKFGASALGKKTQTGVDQTVEIDDSWLCRILAALKEVMPSSQRVFPFDQTHYRRHYNAAQANLKFGKAGGPAHSMRHTRPSFQIKKKQLCLEGVRKRGRWKQMTSVQWYAKEAVLIERMSLVSDQLRKWGGANSV